MEKITYQGKMFAVVEKDRSDGVTGTIEVARRAPGTRLIIETGDGNLLLTKEHRPELGRYDMRLPGGKVFDSLTDYLQALQTTDDLTPAIEAAARKEAKEEVGVEDGDFTWLCKSVCGLTIEWDLHYFVVKNARVGAQALEEGEDIEVTSVSKEAAKQMCLDGSMGEERSALILYRYLTTTT